MKARYIGNPAKGGEGPASITMRGGPFGLSGVEFAKGEWVDVTPEAYARLKVNVHFEAADPLDHDASGEKGGSGKAKAKKAKEQPEADEPSVEAEG